MTLRVTPNLFPPCLLAFPQTEKGRDGKDVTITDYRYTQGWLPDNAPGTANPMHDPAYANPDFDYPTKRQWSDSARAGGFLLGRSYLERLTTKQPVMPGTAADPQTGR